MWEKLREKIQSLNEALGSLFYNWAFASLAVKMKSKIHFTMC